MARSAPRAELWTPAPPKDTLHFASRAITALGCPARFWTLDTAPMHRAVPRIAPVLVAALACAAALWARTTRLTAEPLWLDEAYSAYAAGKGWHFLWTVVPTYEVHPPFYYSLLRLWTLVAGDDLASLRLLGVVTGVAALPMAALALREIGRWLRWSPQQSAWGAAAALTALALSPALTEMAREVRPYPLMILTYAAALAALLRTGRLAAATRRLPSAPFAAYLVTLALMLWLHNLGALFAGALGLGMLAMLLGRRLPRADWWRFVGGHALVALVWAPALLMMLDQAPTWMKSTWLRFSWIEMDDKLALLWAGPGPITRYSAAALGLLALVALLRSGDGRRIALALLFAAIVPVALALALSVAITPVFIVRTMTPVVVPAMLLLAIGATGQRGWLGVPALVAAGVFLSQMAPLALRARAAPPPYDYYGAVDWLKTRWRPGDQIWAYPNEGALPLRYALRDRGITIAVRAIPGDVPATAPGGWFPTGSRGVVSLPRATLRGIAASGARVPTIWLYRLGPLAYDRGDVLVDELSRDRAVIGRFKADPIDIIGLRRRD